MRRLPFLCALALTATSIPSGAIARPTKETEFFNNPRQNAACTSHSSRFPFYPFSVDRIGRALISRKMPKDVTVLIVDNNFFGYRLNDSDEADAPARISSKNFNDAFFRKYGEHGINPWISDDDAPAEESQKDASIMSRHGTYIAGIVLGGMYDDKAPPPDENANLRQPNVRRLLLTEPDQEAAGNNGKSWIELSFINIRYGDGDAGEDPIAKVNQYIRRVNDQMIVNMSLGRTLTGSETTEPLQLQRSTLVVTAAGNSERELSKDGLKAIPAMIDDDGRILVVASHDADGSLSGFSNYGAPVHIAAPGCNIKSWPGGEDPAIALSGTSMATAIVTFAAAMVRSRWSAADGPALRNRLLSSARFEPSLLHCSKLKLEGDSDDRYCVKDGAMLDIEAAVLVLKDFVEYDECTGSDDQSCTTRTAIGTLDASESFVGACIANDVYRKLLYRGGLTFNGAFKKVDRGHFLVAYEPGEYVGDKPLKTKICPVSPNANSQRINFTIEGPQLDGEIVAEPRLLPIEIGRVRRLVTRAVNPQA